VPPAQLEELLAPHPELRWTLEMQGLREGASEEEWRAVLLSVKRQVTGVVQRERRSVKKQNLFAALDKLVSHAASSSTASSARLCQDELSVCDVGCLTRLHRTCEHFEASWPSVGEKRPRQDGPPVTAEECLRKLTMVSHDAQTTMRRALSEHRRKEKEGLLLADASRLVWLIEMPMLDRGLDLAALLASTLPGCAPEDERVSKDLQRLWAEAMLADEALWLQVLSAKAGQERDEAIAKTGFYRMLVSLRSLSFSSRSANLEALCASSESYAAELRPLAPALRLAEAQGEALRSRK